MDNIFIKQFEEKFQLSFNNVVNIEDIDGGVEINDDGIYHYIDISLSNVYSFDIFDKVWLEKNYYKNDILQRLGMSIK
jgi:hypothetical protein